MESKKLVETVAANLGRKPEDVDKLLDALAGVLRARCGEMDNVAIPGFGLFEPKKRNERVMIHPSNGKRMLVPPKIVVGFKVSRVLKAKLNHQSIGKEDSHER
ncbi:MAG: HU family DNA-binding protein [Muribaculaceae bacterium]|jgi:nucleoid DNA-binding protein|nr:HU family DNA-binding protein [Muribaculaceae bacterium]MBQ7205572.1 HU family DNA-binding protein [Muribaculaceae bacterium]